MQISQEEIEAVKGSNDLVSVIRSRNIILKKKGKSLVGLCPFHPEESPSFTVNPLKQLWNCFGCSKTGKSSGGDVIGFVVKYDNITFPEAIEKLGGGNIKKAAKEKKKAPEPPALDSLSPRLQKLLKRVVDFYHTTFSEDDRGLRYLADERKITDKAAFSDFHIGFLSFPEYHPEEEGQKPGGALSLPSRGEPILYRKSLKTALELLRLFKDGEEQRRGRDWLCGEVR